MPEALMCEMLQDARITVCILINDTGCPKMNLKFETKYGQYTKFQCMEAILYHICRHFPIKSDMCIY